MCEQEVIDTATVALVFGVTAATVRQWAHRGKLRRIGTNQRRQATYDWGQVNALYDDMYPGADTPPPPVDQPPAPMSHLRGSRTNMPRAETGRGITLSGGGETAAHATT